MKKLNLLFGLFMLLALSAQAQYAFKVLAAKGSNQVLSNGNWKSLSAGNQLFSKEKLKLTSGGYLGLIHSTGKTLELKTPGTYSVADLEAKIITGRSTFGEKYGKFVANGMFAGNPDAKNNYNTTGAVDRAIDKTSLVIYAPKKIKALKHKPLTLNWNDCGKGHVYMITLKNFYNEEIYSVESKTNSVTIDFNNHQIPEGLNGNYLLQVVSKTDPSYTTSPKNLGKESKNQSYSIQVINAEQSSIIEKKINNLHQELNASSALDQMVLAAAYEQEDLMAYAVESYKKAKILAPDVEQYRIQYEEYIKTKLALNNLEGGTVQK